MENKKYDIGVLGWWYGENYGSMLTYYALNRTLKKMGHSVLMIHESLGYNGWRVHWAEDIDPMQFADRVGYDYTKQIHFSEMGQYNEICKSFLVGSDQLWNPLIGRVNDDLFLDFAEEGKPRFAYGTSFGNRDTDKFSVEFIEKHKVDLKNFTALSVREDYGVDIAKNIFDVEAEQVVDPVFLLNKEEYIQLAENATYKTEGDYLLSFILDPNDEKRQAIDAVAKKLGLEKIYILANPEDRSGAEKVFAGDKYTLVEENKPENWLYAYQNANYVVTDSFHGSCFAFIFEKPFSSFFNQVRGADRFVNLMKMFELGETRRILQTDRDEQIMNNPNVTFDIDFTAGKVRTKEYSDKSYAWLKNALSVIDNVKTDEEIIAELKKENSILKQTIAILSKDHLDNGGTLHE